MDTISVIIETPAGSGQKYTYDPVNGRMKLKKILPAGMVFPFDFGFLPGTKGGDGDPLDVIVLSECSTFPTCAVECRVIGAFVIHQSQSSKSDKVIRNDRFIAVPVVSLVYEKVNTLRDLPKELRAQLEAFFTNYIEQEGKRLKVEKRIPAEQAWKLIHRFQDRLEKTLLFEIFLPLKNNKNSAFPQHYFDDLRHLLVRKFGGVTVYQRSPVTGIWDNPEEGHERDELIIYEVMSSTGEEVFWTQLKADLANQFKQDKLLIRSSRMNII
ncbi:inorganic diphosphatase [Sphingobacterium sp. DN00404]|uniref:inorganic diphosphatase n=1 Tax=Sphingobacterium micropteri TaxID=2763501 RepID=A0ABR7YLV3_9SPHI|nr:inorganic diphosphatase [Sphingobacterium micropteri]MBD1432293.1 inorganic diphosphatase [Sphingobacterium micropteri]